MGTAPGIIILGFWTGFCLLILFGAKPGGMKAILGGNFAKLLV
jgi:hypothetical protein